MSRSVGQRAVDVLGAQKSKSLEIFQMPEDLDLIWLEEPLENQLLHPWRNPFEMTNTNVDSCQMVSEKITLQSHSGARLDLNVVS